MTTRSHSIRDFFTSLRISTFYAFRFVKNQTIIIFILDVCSRCFPYLETFLFGLLINRITAFVYGGGTEVASDVFILFALYAVVDSIPTFLMSIRSYYYQSWRLRFSEKMELDTLRKREAVDIAHYEDPTFQDLQQRAFQRGMWPFIELVENQFALLANSIAFVVGSLLASFFNIWVYVIILVFSVPKFVMQWKYGQKIYGIWAKDSPEQRRYYDLRRFFTNRVAVIETKLNNQKNHYLSWIQGILSHFNTNLLQAEKKRRISYIITDFLYIIGFTWSSIIILQDVLAGTILVGSMVYALNLLSRINGSFANILSVLASQNEKHLIVQDMMAFLSIKPLVQKANHPQKLDLVSPPEIVFEHVSFAYPGKDKLVLRDLNLTFKAGEKIALVGNNGAGKTTLIKLLCRIYDPTEGRILINGKDLREIDLDEWWENLAVLFQDYVTHDFLVKEAIAINKTGKKIDMEKVKEAATISQANLFIDKFSKGYDEQLGVEFGGVELSKGQRQKMALARTLYKNTFFLILDEPTASIDAESEVKIFEFLNNLPKTTGSLYISHDFATVKESDKIFVLEEGRVVEEGSHKELMKHEGGVYKRLFDLQKQSFK